LQRDLIVDEFQVWFSSLTDSSWFSVHCAGMLAGSDHQVNVKWKTVGSLIENGVVWDSVYYVQIAQCGYEYEQTHAFLPVLPLTMRFLANTGRSLIPPLSCSVSTSAFPTSSLVIDY
jgi:hypothetical protein